VKWFRKHIKTGSRLALFAFAVQFALSFGHFHAAAQAAPAIQAALTQADPPDAGSLANDWAVESAQQQQPSNPDTDRQPADACAICAVIALAGNLLFAAPPALLLPQAIELLYLATEAGFVHLNPAHPAFQSRAPPVS
jgi:uncharacterized iron-regulated membrane protein